MICIKMSIDFVLILPPKELDRKAFFVCFDCLCPSQQIFSHVGTGLPPELRIKCLAQGHNAVPLMRLEPTTLDLESSTLPLR